MRDIPAIQRSCSSRVVGLPLCRQSLSLRTFNRDDGKADDSLVVYILGKTVTASAQLYGGLGSASGHDRAARGVAGVGSGPGSLAR